MRTVAQKPKAPQRTTSAKPAIPGRAWTGQSPAGDPILHLQRTIGNQAVQRLLEADTGDDKAPVQLSGKLTAAANRTSEVLQGLQAARTLANPGAGEPLSRPDREAMSARFGYYFGRVRIHTGSEAARCRGAGVRERRHVWFRPDAGRPIARCSRTSSLT